MASVGDSGHSIIKNCILKGVFLSWDQSQHQSCQFFIMQCFLSAQT